MNLGGHLKKSQEPMPQIKEEVSHFGFKAATLDKLLLWNLLPEVTYHVLQETNSLCVVLHTWPRKTSYEWERSYATQMRC